MSSLVQKQCVPCRGGEPTLNKSQISNFKSKISVKWQVIEDKSVKKLTRNFKFKNFAEAMAFVTKVGEIAEQEGHHPEIEVGWGHATVSWWTHKIGGLHQNDFIMAAKTDSINP